MSHPTEIRFRSAAALMLAAALVALPARDATGQEDADSRWLAWLGCWTEVGTAEADDGGQLLCVRSAADGVELLTVRGGTIVEARTLRADGEARETEREGCTGTERAEFSSDGHRIFLRSDYICEGGVERSDTGILAFVSPTEWIRVETVAVSGESAAVTRRFRVAPTARVEGTGLEDIAAGRSMAVRAARMDAASRLTADDVIEASETVDTEAVRAWVAERDEPLRVDADRLVRMAEAGVSDEVIDVVVAVSFPDHFTVDRDVPGDRARRRAARGPYGGHGYRGRGYGYYDPIYDPYFYSPFYYGYYSRFGYGYPFGHLGRPTVIVVSPRADDGGGRVVSGQGYRRGPATSGSGTARDPNPSIRRIEQPSDGRVTPRGMSGGGSSGSTGRTAKPREGSSDDGGN